MSSPESSLFLDVSVPNGGEWVAIGETFVTAAKVSGTSVPRVAMAAAWWRRVDNVIQPFWMIPLLAISGLSVRDIMAAACWCCSGGIAPSP